MTRSASYRSEEQCRYLRPVLVAAFDGVGSVCDNPRVLRLLTRAIPALIVAAWLAPSFVTIAVGFHLWADHHGELHSDVAHELDTELSDGKAHRHQIAVGSEHEAARLSRTQIASGLPDAVVSSLPGTIAPTSNGTTSVLPEACCRYGPAPPCYLSHCAFLL